MKNTRRKFTPEDRLSIIQEAQREGHSVTCRKYNLSPSFLTKWKARYLNKGVTGLQNTYKKVDPQVKELELENERLKRIIAPQASWIQDTYAPQARWLQDTYEDLLHCVKDRFNENDVKLIQKAYEFAFSTFASRTPRKKPGEPYIIHPLTISIMLVKDLVLDSTSIISCILKDVIEDTDYTIKDISSEFGPKVALIVDGLTKFSEDDYYYKKILFKNILINFSKDIRIILIKLAEILYYMRSFMPSLPRHRIIKFIDKVLYLYVPLANRLGLYNIKRELTELCLKYKYPEDYHEIMLLLHKHEIERNVIKNEFIKSIHEILNTGEQGYTVVSRIKSINSIWKRIHNEVDKFDRIYGPLEFIIIVNSLKGGSFEKENCFKIYSNITNIYEPDPRKFRDWITNPKINGYESIHGTVMDLKGNWLDLQIKTERMDQIALYGLAAPLFVDTIQYI